MLLQDRIENGFTLIELVTVIVLLSVLSVVALPRLGGLSVFEEKAFFDEVTNAVRYAQKRARSTGCNVQVSLTATSYRLRQGSSCTSATYNRNVLHPLDRTTSYSNLSFPDGLTISPASTLIFSAISEVSFFPTSAAPHVFSVGGHSFTVHEKSGLVDVN